MTEKKKLKSKIVLTKGRKKMAIARVRIKDGKGMIKINGRALDVFEPQAAKEALQEPIMMAEEVLGPKFYESIDIKANINGGGVMGQAYACRTAIGKALVAWSGSADLKKKYHDYDRSLIIDDARSKEPKKFLRKGARAKPTKSFR
ncbi:MAG: 30S ribosomal protein S9 [Candidatus Micrarchaeota archaeon]